ncbi:MAG: hypothetical protein ACTTKK_08120, partial [Ottowia sp.]
SVFTQASVHPNAPFEFGMQICRPAHLAAFQAEAATSPPSCKTEPKERIGASGALFRFFIHSMMS